MNRVILFFIAMSLFFGLMYLYAWGTTEYKERRDLRRKAKEQKMKEAQIDRIKSTMKESRTVLKEKYDKMEERSRQIQEELARIQMINKKWSDKSSTN